MNCPKCSSSMRSNGIRKRASGAYRKMLCPSCGYFEKHDLGGGGRLPPSDRRFDAATVREIIRSSESHAALSRVHGCSKELIRQIRAGLAYRDLLPYGHLPRDAKGPRCDQCVHWAGDHCGLGLPDPEEEGLHFARDCAARMAP